METIEKPNFVEAINLQRRTNISNVRKSLQTKNMMEKIYNHAIRVGRSEQEIINEIISNDLYAEFFAIDPAKQNIYEKTAAKFLSSQPLVSNFKNLPATAKVFVVNGVITNDRNGDNRSIDFTFNASWDGSLNFYAWHKYTGTGHGAAQKHQYSETRKFLEECKKSTNKKDFFLAILDGPYYEKYNYIHQLNSEFSSDRVRILQSHQVSEFLAEIRK